MFVDTGSSEDDDFNPDCECNIEAEQHHEEPASSSQASATSPSGKRVEKKRFSKKRALTKAERKRLNKRLCDVDLQLLWHEITCKLRESVVSDTEPDSDS